MKSILDRTFVYVPAHQTDIRVTFERIRKDRAAETERLEKLRASITPIRMQAVK